MIAEREQVIGGIITVLSLVAIGVGVGISNTGNNSSPLSSSSNGPDQPDSNDPSSFVVDKRLHRSLYGLAYTPEGSLLPDCGNSLEEVIKDVQVGLFFDRQVIIIFTMLQLMSQLTTRVRLYGADCNQSALVVRGFS